MTEDFTIDALHQLVDQAMHDDVGTTPLDRLGVGVVPFAFGDTQLFARLAPLLERYLAPVDVAVFLDELRSTLAEGVERPSLRSVHTIVSHCRRCPEMQPDPQLPVGNFVNPDIVFVHEMPYTKLDTDEIWADVFTAAGLRSDAVVHTSLVRCLPLTVRVPSPTEVETCTRSYLYTELAALQPKLIMPLGTTPTATLLGSSESLGRDRGRLFWLGPWAILPSYAPGYAHRRAEARDGLAADLARAARYCYRGP